MWRFLMPAFAMMAALVVLFAGALNGLQSVPGWSDRILTRADDPALRPVPPPSSPPSPATVERPPPPGIADKQATRDALQRQIDDLWRQDSALQDQIAQHKLELTQRPVDKPPPSATADQQATREALQRQVDDLRRQGSSLQSGIADLQRQGSSLQGGIADLQRQDEALQHQIAQHKQELAQQTQQGLSTSLTAQRDQQAARDALQRQVAELQRQVTDLQQQDSTMQGQIARHKEEIAQQTQEVAQRTQDLTQRSLQVAQKTQELAARNRDLDAARVEADKLQQSVDTLRQQRQSEEAQLTRQKTAAQQPVAMTVPARPAVPKRAPPPAQPASLPSPTQPTPAPQPTDLMPAPSAVQQLRTARQWLSSGRPDEARRVLAMVQTQMVFQPVTPDQPAASGGNPSATAIGDAIRWLDMGASGQAMQSITRAIDDANFAHGQVRAWSGYSGTTPPDLPRPDYYRSGIER